MSSAPSTPSTSKRRSARVQKRDPVVAPGFGTFKDVKNLSSSLGLPLEAVQAIMESRGRGIRGARKSDDAKSQAPPTPISTAWADFMTEEGMAPATEKEETTTQEATNTMMASTTTRTENMPREYKLPLVKDWITEAEPKKKKLKAMKKTQGSLLVQTGTLDSSMIGRNKRTLDKPYDLQIPTSIMPSLSITRVIAGCNASHALCIDTSGNAYGWGRNEAQQLSQTLPTIVPLPTRLELEGITIVDGAVGKSHTILLDSDHQLWAVGANKSGQCGVRTFTDVPNFRKCVLSNANIVQVSCGEAFSVALSDDGRLHTTGSSQFGQLGNGEEGKYFVSANKLSYANCNIFIRRDVFCHVPGETNIGMPPGISSGNDYKVVPMEENVRIGYIACGKHHTVAIEAPSEVPPRVFTWGCGNYGCLGHGVQQDEYHPRLVATLSSGPLWQSNPAVSAAAGSSCSMILTERGHVYYWGKHRSVGEAMMRPTLLDALANNGHVVTHMAAGAMTVVCSTENAVTVSWGMGPHGELGYGEKKSSSKPAFIPKLDKCRINDLACGQGITLFAVAEEDADDKAAIKQLPVLDPKAVAELETE